MTTRRNGFSFGGFICVKAHRCIKALRTSQTEHAASQLYTTVNRRTCSSVPAPRITTHYTIHPRAQDSRWEGKAAEPIIPKILCETQFELLTSQFRSMLEMGAFNLKCYTESPAVYTALMMHVVGVVFEGKTINYFTENESAYKMNWSLPENMAYATILWWRVGFGYVIFLFHIYVFYWYKLFSCIKLLSLYLSCDCLCWTLHLCKCLHINPVHTYQVDRQIKKYIELA